MLSPVGGFVCLCEKDWRGRSTRVVLYFIFLDLLTLWCPLNQKEKEVLIWVVLVGGVFLLFCEVSLLPLRSSIFLRSLRGKRREGEGRKEKKRREELSLCR